MLVLVSLWSLRKRNPANRWQCSSQCAGALDSAPEGPCLLAKEEKENGRRERERERGEKSVTWERFTDTTLIPLSLLSFILLSFTPWSLFPFIPLSFTNPNVTAASHLQNKSYTALRCAALLCTTLSCLGDWSQVLGNLNIKQPLTNSAHCCTLVILGPNTGGYSGYQETIFIPNT